MYVICKKNTQNQLRRNGTGIPHLFPDANSADQFLAERPHLIEEGWYVMELGSKDWKSDNRRRSIKRKMRRNAK